MHSGQSRDGVVHVSNAVRAVLVVHRLPLKVVVCLVVDGAVDGWLQRVCKQEQWHHWEHQTDIVARETHVQHAVALEGAPRLHPPAIVGLGAESHLLFAEALNVHVDVALQLRLDLEALDHLHDLVLLLAHVRVGWPNLLEVLRDMVLVIAH